MAKLAADDELRRYVQDRLAGVIAASDGTSVPGPNVHWSGRRHGPRQDRRWAASWSPEQNSRGARSASLRLNVIHVFERRPPRDEPAVEWFLLTNLPIDSPEAIAFAVDCYRGRWVIEEFFKALKTGCQYERRQLESAHSLLNALAILAPVAWRLLLRRHLAQTDERAPATAALTPKQLEVLHAVAKRPFLRNPRPARRCSPSRPWAGT